MATGLEPGRSPHARGAECGRPAVERVRAWSPPRRLRCAAAEPATAGARERVVSLGARHWMVRHRALDWRAPPRLGRSHWPRQPEDAVHCHQRRTKKLDLARVLRDAIDRGRVADLVRDAEPKFVQYRNLKVTYGQYRALATDSTIPTVTAPRVVRPGGAFTGVDALRRRLVAFGDLPSEAGALSRHRHDVRQYRRGRRGEVPVASRSPRRQFIGRSDARGSECPPGETPVAARAGPGTDSLALRARCRPIRDRERAGVPALRLRHVRHGWVPTLTMNVVVGKAELATDPAVRARHGVHCLPPVLGDPSGNPSREILGGAA